MRVLIVGAGALGGYIGGRLLTAGRDTTFLVRASRARKLQETGLVIKSASGDTALADPPTVTTDALQATFDLIVLSCKAYDLSGAIEAFAPAVGPNTLILPVLNGLRHIEILRERFGASAVLGGHCFISAGRDAEGRILHFGELQSLTFGSRDGISTPSVEQVRETLSVPGIDVTLTSQIMQEMWEKWVFIATGACATSLMRSSIGDIVAAGGSDVVLRLHDECTSIAAGNGYAPRPASIERVRSMFTAPGSIFTASMFRDIEAGAPTEADHVVGDLVARAGRVDIPTLRIALAHLETYEIRRRREAAETTSPQSPTT